MSNQFRLLTYGVLFSVAIHLLLFRLTLPLMEGPEVRHLQVELGLRPADQPSEDENHRQVDRTNTPSTIPEISPIRDISTNNSLPKFEPVVESDLQKTTKPELTIEPQVLKPELKKNPETTPVIDPGPPTGSSSLQQPATQKTSEENPRKILKTPGKVESVVAAASFLAAEGIDNPPPTYPDLARRRGWEGDVLLRLTITAKGDVEKVVVLESSGHRLLDRSALRQVRRWQFRAAQQNGRPVTSEVDLPVKFRLR